MPLATFFEIAGVLFVAPGEYFIAVFVASALSLYDFTHLAKETKKLSEAQESMVQPSHKGVIIVAARKAGSFCTENERAKQNHAFGVLSCPPKRRDFLYPFKQGCCFAIALLRPKNIPELPALRPLKPDEFAPQSRLQIFGH